MELADHSLIMREIIPEKGHKGTSLTYGQQTAEAISKNNIEGKMSNDTQT